MTDVMSHRGPDDSGTLLRPAIALGHRRLSVVDLSAHGRQPMSNEDGSVWIVYNGEVYNAEELKARHRLVEKGHRFRSHTDTEVLVHLYEELGLEMVTELNGMFAYAIWDERSQQLHLARDRSGIKPLFYCWQNDAFLFASEIKGLLQYPGVPRNPDMQALHDFLTFGYVPGTQTAFAGISELPPAHVLTIERQGPGAPRRYWDLEFRPDESISEAEAVEAVRAKLRDAVSRQLRSDIPVGVMLSGGIDSSAIVAMLRELSDGPIATFAIGFSESSFNELPSARVVSSRFRTSHTEIHISPEMVRELLPETIRFIDEPYADGSAIPTMCLCKAARCDVGVLLSGEGGDEAFAGYETHSASRAAAAARRVPGWIRNGLVAPLVRQLPVSDRKLSLEFKMKRFLGGIDLPPAEAHLWWRIILSERQKEELYQPGVLRSHELLPSVRHFSESFDRCSAPDELSRLLYLDSTIFLPDDLMIKNDRMSMAHSVETRVPFTDVDLVDYAARLPSRFKLRGMRKKHVLRQALRDVLPPVILNKKKVGLEMPYSLWLKRELRPTLLGVLNDNALGATNIFRPEVVRRWVDEHLSGRADHGRFLWSLLSYMLWWKMLVAEETVTAAAA